MASVSKTMAAVDLGNLVSNIVSRLLDSFTEIQKKRLSQWIKDIESVADENVQRLLPNQKKRRQPEIIAAAAVYDAILQYESRTQVRVPLSHMQTALGLSACSINTAWKRLFDTRVFLRGEKLDVVYAGKDDSALDVIPNVIQSLRKAAKEDTEEVRSWLAEIEKEAIELTKTIPPSTGKNYDALLVAVTAIYAAIQLYHGKSVIPIGQKDMSILGATSSSMISKCWLEFFGS